MKSFTAALGALALALTASAADAAVTYTFDNGGAGGVLDEKFTFAYTASDFVIPPTNGIPQECDTGPFTCKSVNFYPDHYDITPFLNTGPYEVIGLVTSNGENFYQYIPGAFSTPGFYHDAFFGRDTLTVAEISAAPEPNVWALMIGSIGLAGFALRRRKVTGAPLPQLAG